MYCSFDKPCEFKWDNREYLCLSVRCIYCENAFPRIFGVFKYFFLYREKYRDANLYRDTFAQVLFVEISEHAFLWKYRNKVSYTGVSSTYFLPIITVLLY